MVAKMPVVQNSIGKSQEALPVVRVDPAGNTVDDTANGYTGAQAAVGANGTVGANPNSWNSTAASATVPVASGLLGGAGVVSMIVQAATATPAMLVKVSNDGGVNWYDVRAIIDSTGAVQAIGTGLSTAGNRARYDVAGYQMWGLFQTAAGTATTEVFFGATGKTMDVNLPSALPTGGNIIGAIGPSATVTTGAMSTARLVSAAATTNSTLVKAGAGRLYKVTGFNASAAVKYLKLYNKVSAPTVGTDTPVWTEALPVGKFELNFADIGMTFATGIGYGLTGAPADADTTALVAADVVALNFAYA